MRFDPFQPCKDHACGDTAYTWTPIGKVNPVYLDGGEPATVSVELRPEGEDAYGWRYKYITRAARMLDEHDAAPWSTPHLYTAGPFPAPLLVTLGGGITTRDDVEHLAALAAPRIPGEESDEWPSLSIQAEPVDLDNTHTVAVYEWPVHLHQEDSDP